MEPSITLPARDLKAFLDAAAGLSRAMPAEEDVPELLRSISNLVGCDRLFWNRLRTSQPVHRIVEIGLPHAPARDIVLPNDEWDDWVTHRHEHPIMSGKHGPVTAISDVYSPREFKNTWLYQEAVLAGGGLADEFG